MNEAVDNTPDTTPEVDLDSFSDDFFGQKDSVPAPASAEEVDEVDEDVSDAPLEPAEEDDVEENPEEEALDDPEDDEDEEDSTPEPPKKKNRFQDRIDELTGARREAERKAQELEEKLNKVLEKLEQNEPKPEPKARDHPAPDGDNGRPNPYDKNEDGTDKYPLGEYDPNFTIDLTDWRLDQREQEREQKLTQKQQEVKDAEVKQELAKHWEEKLAPAQERYPDFDEKGENLSPILEKLDPSYAQYIAATVMSMDNGPDVLYYLAENVDEAEAIFASGPQKATLALGRIESRFVQGEGSPTKRRVSKAPTPPPTNKGSAPAQARVKPDTDNLDAFEKEFFKSR